MKTKLFYLGVFLWIALFCLIAIGSNFLGILGVPFDLLKARELSAFVTGLFAGGCIVFFLIADNDEGE